jgi:hypothetical protein
VIRTIKLKVAVMRILLTLTSAVSALLSKLNTMIDRGSKPMQEGYLDP